jgi:hypothetical protein
MKTNHVVVRALVDDAICLRLEPNKPELTRRASQQGERHELDKVRRHRAARHATAVNLLDVSKELEVEEWVDSLPLGAPPPPQASCDSGRGARVLQARELAVLRRRHAGEAHERWWPGRVGCGCNRARGCLRRQLGLGASV